MDTSNYQEAKLVDACKTEDEKGTPLSLAEMRERYIDDMEFDRLGVFTYSQEEDTPAAAMEYQIPEEVKKERRAEAMELQQEISLEKCHELQKV